MLVVANALVNAKRKPLKGPQERLVVTAINPGYYIDFSIKSDDLMSDKWRRRMVLQNP